MLLLVIDGDFRNCSEENLTVLCPNCHSLTPTFMSLNRGNGRDVAGVRRRKKVNAAVAQIGLEHLIGNEEVAGSTPVCSSTFCTDGSAATAPAL